MSAHPVRCPGCGAEHVLIVRVELDHAQLEPIVRRLGRIEAGQEKIMTALEDERAALADLTTEVGDILDALATQVQGGVSESDSEQVAADIRAQADRLRAALTPTESTPAEPTEGDGTQLI
jgi:hypothetical protein